MLPLCGCVSTSKVIEQLKNDPAKVHFQVNSPWGTIVFDREFPTNWTQPIIVTMPSTVTTNR